MLWQILANGYPVFLLATIVLVFVVPFFAVLTRIGSFLFGWGVTWMQTARTVFISIMLANATGIMFLVSVVLNYVH